jgi:hypothetical protein
MVPEDRKVMGRYGILSGYGNLAERPVQCLGALSSLHEDVIR